MASSDERIRLVHQENAGLTASLNRALALANGEFIARQDSDDFSFTDRLSSQVSLLDNRPDLCVIGSNSKDLYEGGYEGEWGYIEEDALQKVVYIKTPFPHSSIMMRADVVRSLGGYDETFLTSQDMELWMRMARQGRIGMVEAKLITRHVHKNSISTNRRFRQFYDGLRARLRHNKSKPTALYYSFRHLLIIFLPDSVLRILKRIL